MVLLAAFDVLVSQYVGAEDFGIGTPVAGRDHPDTERLIGHFVNTVVLRADISGNPSFSAVVDRVKAGTLAALEHQHVPFDEVVRTLQPARDLSRNPLVQRAAARVPGNGPGTTRR